jgi:glucose/arabinose dehydrogenase
MLSRPVRLASLGALTAALALVGGAAVSAQTTHTSKPKAAGRPASGHALPANMDPETARAPQVADATTTSGPHTTNGAPLTLVASGMTIPTAFAFGDGQVFVADGGSEDRTASGGVFVLQNGQAILQPWSPAHVYGLAFHNGSLYLSANNQLIQWSNWDGTEFDTHKVIYTGPSGFTGFNGIGFGADGRLYAGVNVGDADNGPTSTPYAREVLSFAATGGNPTVVAMGIRQPWQMAFPSGSSTPYVTDLGQDQNATNPPDFILQIQKGQAYGFSVNCNWTVLSACQNVATPYRFLMPHTDPMGIAINGSLLYFDKFGASGSPQVVSMPMIGGSLTTQASGFTAPIVALGANGNQMYVGDTAGNVYSFTAP